MMAGDEAKYTPDQEGKSGDRIRWSDVQRAVRWLWEASHPARDEDRGDTKPGRSQSELPSSRMSDYGCLLVSFPEEDEDETLAP